MRKERSLEEWQDYVERQIEAARRRKEGKPAEEAIEAVTEPAAASDEAPTAEPEPETSAASRDSIPRVSTEGRALLSWETTSPLASTGVEKAQTSSVQPSVPLPRSGNGASSSPVADRLNAPRLLPAEDRLATTPDETGDKKDEPPKETAPEPLKPYQPSDPRWRSSVAPPTRMRNEPVVTTGHTPARIPLPLKEDENPATASMKEPETAPSVGTTPDRVEADSEAPAEALRVADSNPEMAEEGVVAAEALEEAVSPSNGQDGKAARKRAPRVTTKKAAVQSAAQETPEEAQALWDRVPRHVQALIRTQDNEVAQNSYKKSFRESRSDLIRRLLDPELSLEEAARILGVCPTTVRRYTNRGLLSHHRTGGNQRRFRLSHVLEFMERFGVSLSDTEAEARDETDAPWEKSSPRLEEDLLGSASGSPS